MSGSQLVREFRTAAPDSRLSFSLKALRKPLILFGAGACLLAFGVIIVQAQDSSSVWEVHKQQRPYARTTPLPQVFTPNRPVVQTALGYAPLFLPLAPRRGDAPEAAPAPEPRRGSPRAVKVSPAQRDKDFAEGYLNSSTSYCVRACDGYFFPVGTPNAGDLAAHDAACARQCPAAQTSVFVAPAGSRGIEDAINRKGERYETLRTAFNHRTQIDKACTCNPVGQPRNYSVMNDFTLRKGDYVMGPDGLRQFRGDSSASHRPRDFARADLTKLSREERRTMEAIEAASARGSTASPTLRARISAQVAAAQPAQAARPTQQRAALVGHKAKGQSGQDLRYVGPDVDFDRAR